MIKCIVCGKEFQRRTKNRNSFFCSREHKREYFAKRFERWRSDPGEIVVPENFDVFLMQSELPCLIKGCDWKGKCLSLHVNWAHGVTAAEFRKLTGFSNRTGLATPAYREHCRNNPQVEKIMAISSSLSPEEVKRRLFGHKTRLSNEGVEHHRKARAVRKGTSQPKEKECVICGEKFTVRGLETRKTCSAKCQKFRANEKYDAKRYPMKCFVCDVEFMGKRAQRRNYLNGKPVRCPEHWHTQISK